MSENWSVQVSPKIGDTLVNVRGANVSEVTEHLKALAECGGDIADALSLLRAANAVATPAAPAPAAPEKAAWQPPAAGQAGAPAGDAPTCDHGLRVFKTTKNGKRVWECGAVASGALKWNDSGACKGKWVN